MQNFPCDSVQLVAVICLAWFCVWGLKHFKFEHTNLSNFEPIKNKDSALRSCKVEVLVLSIEPYFRFAVNHLLKGGFNIIFWQWSVVLCLSSILYYCHPLASLLLLSLVWLSLVYIILFPFSFSEDLKLTVKTFENR